MSQLEKAQIGEVNRQGRVSAEVAVQFNPTTLRLQMTNSIDVGKSRGRQAQQYNGTSSTTLTVELEFDSSDEDEGGQPLDVRTKTEAVRKFVLPGGRNSKQAPPRVQFRWGRFVLQGVMASLNEDLDLFSPDGVPLRSKLSISIKEQDPKFEALERGSGANLPAAPPAGGGVPGAPGTAGAPLGDASRVAEALDGESASDFLARNGLVPEAWRAIADGVGDALSLLPGEPIEFNLDLPLGGLSIGGGFELGIGVGLEAQLGLSGSPTTAAGTGADPGGLALASAGGLTAAVQTKAATTASGAVAASRGAFGAPQRVAAPAPPVRDRLRDAIGARTLPAASATAARPAPQVDARAISYGSGVPLRDRVGGDVATAWTVLATRAPAPDRAAAIGADKRGSCGCARCNPITHASAGR